MTDIISEIHACPWKGVIAITGCAPGLVTDLLAPGGGSATLLEAVVPYATKSLEQFIGKKPSIKGWKFCSAEVAAEMASAAFSRATELLELSEEEDDPVFGLGITATLRKNGPEREGRIHQVFLSFQTSNLAYNHHAVFDSELTRVDEEHLVSQVALGVLSRHLLDKHHKPLLPIRTHDGSGALKKDGWWLIKEATERQQFSSGLQKLLDGSSQGLVWNSASDTLASMDHRCARVVIPGSFNPFHEGHRSMVRAAQKYCEKQGLDDLKPILELSIGNVDKGRLSGHEILNRVQGLKEYQLREQDELFADLYITDAASFETKSFIFPNSTFVIGIDTWFRIIDPKYYRNDAHFMRECHAKIKENGCSFLVLGRFVNGPKDYHTLPTDKKTRGLAIGLSEEEFRVDISSTQIRNADAGSD